MVKILDNLNDLKVTELKQLCKLNKLSTSGNKKCLIKRLRTMNNETRSEIGQENMKEIELMKKELELMKRELEICKTEKELLKRELDLVKSEKTESEELQCATEIKETSTNISINFIDNLIPEFSGGENNWENWHAQVLTVKDAYKINNEKLKIIIIGKLKNKALNWFRSKPENICLNLNELLSQLGKLFGTIKNKIDLRRQFENRRWLKNEPFIDYFHGKIELGNKLGLEEAELIEYIIDGINDHQIKNQARIKQFDCLSDLLNSLSGVVHDRKDVRTENPKTFREKPFVVKTNKSDSRCFNCGGRGHWKGECKKNKRDWGTCYRCGKLGHKGEECTTDNRGNNSRRDNE